MASDEYVLLHKLSFKEHHVTHDVSDVVSFDMQRSGKVDQLKPDFTSKIYVDTSNICNIAMKRVTEKQYAVG